MDGSGVGGGVGSHSDPCDGANAGGLTMPEHVLFLWCCQHLLYSLPWFGVHFLLYLYIMKRSCNFSTPFCGLSYRHVQPET